MQAPALSRTKIITYRGAEERGTEKNHSLIAEVGRVERVLRTFEGIFLCGLNKINLGRHVILASGLFNGKIYFFVEMSF